MTDEPIDIHGPVGFWLPEEEPLRSFILKRISHAQVWGELPMRTGGIPRESVVVWIGPKEEPHAFATFYLLEQPGLCVWLDILFVMKAYRRQGYGHLLLKTVEQVAREKGIKQIQLGTAPHNEAMQTLAQRAGWGKRMIVMERKL